MQLSINMTSKYFLKNKDNILSLCNVIPLREWIWVKVRMSLLQHTCEDAATNEVNSHNLNAFCAFSI